LLREYDTLLAMVSEEGIYFSDKLLFNCKFNLDIKLFFDFK
ncbi:MAG: hypothetical protein ACD_5C00358G0001, partial [uncultured bacterium]